MHLVRRRALKTEHKGADKVTLSHLCSALMANSLPLTDSGPLRTLPTKTTSALTTVEATIVEASRDP
jgi:hypothetical protein